MVVSRLGCDVFDFYEMTPVELYWAIHYKVKYITELEKMRDRRGWEKARLIISELWNTTNHQLKKGKTMKPEEVVKFKDELDGKVQSQQEMKQTVLGLAKTFKAKDYRKNKN